MCLLSGYYDVNKKDCQKALKYAEKAINADKNYGYAYYRKGATLYGLGKFNEAYEYLQKAEKLGYSLKAEIFLSMGKQKEADKCYQKINKLKNK